MKRQLLMNESCDDCKTRMLAFRKRGLMRQNISPCQQRNEARKSSNKWNKLNMSEIELSWREMVW